MTADEKQRVIENVQKVIEDTLPDTFEMGPGAPTVQEKRASWLRFATNKIDEFFEINERNRQKTAMPGQPSAPAQAATQSQAAPAEEMKGDEEQK